jgi:hypothetical protein
MNEFRNLNKIWFFLNYGWFSKFERISETVTVQESGGSINSPGGNQDRGPGQKTPGGVRHLAGRCKAPPQLRLNYLPSSPEVLARRPWSASAGHVPFLHRASPSLQSSCRPSAATTATSPSLHTARRTCGPITEEPSPNFVTQIPNSPHPIPFHGRPPRGRAGGAPVAHVSQGGAGEGPRLHTSCNPRPRPHRRHRHHRRRTSL